MIQPAYNAKFTQTGLGSFFNIFSFRIIAEIMEIVHVIFSDFYIQKLSDRSGLITKVGHVFPMVIGSDSRMGGIETITIGKMHLTLTTTMSTLILLRHC